MPVSLYDACIPVMDLGLRHASTILDMGRQFADETGISRASLLETRFASDMFTLVGQVQRFCDTAKNTAVRVGGIANAVMPDDETTFEDLQSRIARTAQFLQTVSAEAVVSREGAQVILPAPGGNRVYTGTEYVFEFALPNFFFHVATTYDLLRHRGVPLGKRHYLGWSDKL